MENNSYSGTLVLAVITTKTRQQVSLRLQNSRKQPYLKIALYNTSSVLNKNVHHVCQQ